MLYVTLRNPELARMDIRRLFEGLGLKRGSDPDIAPVTTIVAVPKDETILRAAWEAVQALPAFLTALRSPGPGARDFCVKVLLRENGIDEFVWVDRLRLEPGRLVGQLQGQPRHVPGYARGQTMTVPFIDVVDWTYMDGPTRRGNYTGLAVEALQRAARPPRP